MLSERDLGHLIERMERLERSGRRWKRLGILSVAGVGLLLSTGATRPAAPSKLDVAQIVVRDKDGKARLTIGTDKSGSPYMVLSNKDELPRFSLGLGGGPNPTDNPYLNFSDGEFRPRLLMGLGGGPEEGDNPYFNLRSKDMKILFSAP